MKRLTLMLTMLAVVVILLSLSACGLFDQAEAPSNQQPTQGPAITGHTPASPQQPQATQSPAGCTDQFVQVGPASIPNGQEFDPGESFQVDWTVKNVGTCTWSPTYALVHTFGNELGAISLVSLGTSVAPEDTVTLSLQMSAPSTEDEYPSFWKLQNDQGQVFGKLQNDAPLRVVINVVALQASPQPTSEVQVAEGPPIGAFEYGYDQTMLVNQCFDLVSGEVANCTDTDADIKFTFAPNQGGYILPLHELALSAGIETQPTKSTCEASSFLTFPLEMLLPASSSTGKYYCFFTERGINRYYGWLQPVSFISGGLTFNFVTFDPSSTITQGQVEPAVIDSIFVLVEADQVTLLTDHCFSLTTGVEVSCNSADASFSWSSDFSGKTSVMIGTIVSGYTESDEQSKTECQAEDYSLGGDYYCTWGLYYSCFQTQYGNETVYGWIRPTHCNANGVTFDFRTYKP